jgi:Tol biopolymer transport system component
MQPSLAPAYPGADPSSAIVNCLPDGFIGRLGYGVNIGGQEMPVFADGHWWWYLLGQGWSAEDWLVFHHEGEFPYPGRPELAAAGLIAYIGQDQNVWVMSADGSGPRIVAARASEREVFNQLQWSPSGELLAFTVSTYGESPTFLTRLIDGNGALVRDIPGVVEAQWSPDSTSLSAIRVERPGELGGYHGTPVVMDVTASGLTELGPSSFMLTSAAWSPDGAQLAFTCQSWTSTESQADGTVKETRVDCGGDGLRLVTADGVHSRVLIPFSGESSESYGNPAWSPDGTRVSVSTGIAEGTACRGYRIVEAASGALGGCIALPPWGGFGGGCGGSSETGATDWSPDGRYLAYHSMFGAGTNGVYLRDVATGATRVIPSNQPSSISFSGDGAHLVFAGAGYIWVVDPDGGGLALLGAGYSPSWQPR